MFCWFPPDHRSGVKIWHALTPACWRQIQQMSALMNRKIHAISIQQRKSKNKNTHKIVNPISRYVLSVSLRSWVRDCDMLCHISGLFTSNSTNKWLLGWTARSTRSTPSDEKAKNVCIQEGNGHLVKFSRRYPLDNGWGVATCHTISSACYRQTERTAVRMSFRWVYLERISNFQKRFLLLPRS